MAFGIRTSWFQTFLAQKAAAFLSNELQTEINIDRVDIVFFDRVDIEGVFVEDKFKDTLLYTQTLHINIADFSISESFVDIDEVRLEKANVNLRKAEGDTTFNFQHLVDYFASDKEDEDTTSTEFDVLVRKFTLDQIDFSYHDENAEPVEYGLDYANLDINRLSGEFTNFELQGDAILVDIANLKMIEKKSGLAIRKLTTDLKYSPKIVQLKELEFGFNNSKLIADSLVMRTPNGTADFENFVHDVSLAGAVNNSIIDLKDLSIIVPNLRGMVDVVRLNNVDFEGPVYGMKLNNTDISLLDSTIIKGDLQIPNLDDPNAEFSENIKIFQTTTTDIQRLRLTPFLEGEDFIKLPENISGAGRIVLKDLTFDGSMNKFEVDGSVYSSLGNLSSENGLAFEVKEDGLYHYKGIGQNKKDLIVDRLNLRALSGSDMLGTSSGYLTIRASKGFAPEDINLNFDGRFSTLTLNGYDYQNIIIKRGHFEDNQFIGNIDVRDKNLAMNYNGKINLNDMSFKFDMHLDSANLSKLNFTPDSMQTALHIDSIHVDIKGTDINKIVGNMRVRDLHFEQSGTDFQLDQLDLVVDRGERSDSIDIRSELLDAKLTGRFDLIDIWPVVQHQLARVVDHLVEDTDISATKSEFFDLRIDLKNINSLLPFVDEKLYVAPGAIITSSYSLADLKLDIDVQVDSVRYEEMLFEGIRLNNYFDSLRANVQYQVAYVEISDSLHATNLALFSYVKDNSFSTNFGWDGDGQIEPGLFAFKTIIQEDKDILTEFKPSFFFLKGQKWDLSSESKVLYNSEKIEFTDFAISGGTGVVSVNGIISENPEDWLYFNVKDFNLADLNGLLGNGTSIGGTLNIDGGVADIYNEIRFESTIKAANFEVDDELVGDLSIENTWDKNTNSVSLNGSLNREGKETLKFEGDYYADKEKNNVNVDIIFDYTDISFLNAFSDPELYKEIDGILDGRLKITGELTDPIIKGSLELVDASVLVPMFNVTFGASGRIDMADGEIIVESMDLYDQEGNSASAQMQIYHYDWADWNYDITLDMDSPRLSRRFLVMDTEYRDGDLYYGKAYISGDVNIFGYDAITEINVNATTRPGTDIKLAIFGTGDLEESSFIVFDTIIPRYNPDSLDNANSRIQSSGLVLNMKFNVTKDAKATIIFDPIYEDQIVVNSGEGVINLNMDEYGEMDMYGKYTILDGNYFMRLQGLVKKDFQIRNGSTVAWTKSPYDAFIDIKADFARETSIDPILPPGIEDRSDDKQIVIGTLSMSNTLMSPALGFSIAAPNADDIEQAALSALNSDKDRLNKQFFALLVLNRFLASESNQASGGGNNAAYNIAEGQVNTILDNIGDNYDLSADIEEGKTAVGFQTQVGERITIKTSLGVVSGDEETNGAIIGDVVVEYRLNEDGTFTVKIFNESNTGSDSEKGPFTQGVGLHYEETFNTAREFKLLQGFLNIFRSKENDVDYKTTTQDGKKVPVEGALERLEQEDELTPKNKKVNPEIEKLLKETNEKEEGTQEGEENKKEEGEGQQKEGEKTEQESEKTEEEKEETEEEKKEKEGEQQEGEKKEEEKEEENPKKETENNSNE